MKRNDEPLERLLRMIDSYFECSLSDGDETRLRAIIATTSHRHPAIDEARALMGFRQATTTVADACSRPAHTYFRAAIGVAAALTVIVGVTVSMIRHSTPKISNGTTCVAYTGGHIVTDEAAVLDRLRADMGDFGECADEIMSSANAEIGEIFDEIDRIESAPVIISI